MGLNHGSSNGAPVTVTLLGTGDAFASCGRSQAGYLIDAPAGCVLLEAGPGLLAALKKNSFPTDSFDLLLISHLHGDHYGGLPFLILEYMFEAKRKRVLTIAGPRQLEERTWRLMRTMFPHFDLDQIKHKLKFVVLEPGTTTRLGKFSVSAIRSPHTKPDISLSLRVDGGGKSIVFSGDTGWNDHLVKLSEGADLFLCECTYYESAQLTFHLNYPLLAANRDKFKVRRMVLTHLGREVLNRENEVAIEMGFDGMKIEI
ncbi:MAG: MBL fold metallo-hydrolase [Candidatus Binatus sp.]|uniref:MBL fold metallo-hydrolase n=1 Tax=Candidatus Binatus sp. TaxID=2811406 RepID=UPI002719759D|nr:MBL fold metallo-hydrolase [Candidatus Binatus sp.]MDO8431965.1 MBL fold metallo-hydrolase [Candidatus Binatus sp.]